MTRPAIHWDDSSPGWLLGLRHIKSPNCDARPPATAVDLLVIHHISLPAGRFSGDAIERLFTNRLEDSADPQLRELAVMRVSAHFLIRRRGECLQFVSTRDRAWHAGASSLHGRERCNDFSLGIELEGDLLHPFTAAQYRRLVQLTRLLAQAHPLRFVAGHSDIAPGRKMDPGPYFDWSRYLAALDLARLSRPF